MAASLQLTCKEVEAIASEAYVFFYPIVEHYRVMFYQSVWKDSPKFVASFNRFGHARRLLDHKSSTVVSPNNDTLYSVAWLDLRAEPVVLSTPEVSGGRYYSMQLIDGCTHNVAILSPRTTGKWQAASYLVVGPSWTGPLPDKAGGVAVTTLRTESEFVLVLARTQVYGADDVVNVWSIQKGYSAAPLSALSGTKRPAAPPTDLFPPIMPGRPVETESFFTCANFAMQYIRIDEQEVSMFKRFKRIGVEPGVQFNCHSCEFRDSIHRGVLKGHTRLEAFSVPVKNGWTVNADPPMFGPRQVMRGRHLTRAAAAHLALYGLDPDEAVYYVCTTDADGDALDSTQCGGYVLCLPPSDRPRHLPGGFWSVTMYHLPDRLLVSNEIDRYSIGDRTPGIQHATDGSLSIVMQPHRPDDPLLRANWLPAPQPPAYSGKFCIMFRLFWPERYADSTLYVPPPVFKAGDRRSKL